MQSGRMWGWGHVGGATKIQEARGLREVIGLHMSDPGCIRMDKKPGVLKLSRGENGGARK